MVSIFAPTNEALTAVLARIEDIIAEAELGEVYDGEVVRIADFGAFVSILPNKDGLLHISQISHERVNKVTDVLNVGDKVKVKVTEIDRMGRVKLSMKELLPKPEESDDAAEDDKAEKASDKKVEKTAEKEKDSDKKDDSKSKSKAEKSEKAEKADKVDDKSEIKKESKKEEVLDASSDSKEEEVELSFEKEPVPDDVDSESDEDKDSSSKKKVSSKSGTGKSRSTGKKTTKK